MAPALDAGPDERGPRRPPATAGANRAIATPLIAAVRSAVIGPASRIAAGTPVRGSVSSTRPWIAGSPSARLPGKPAIHFIPSRSSRPSGRRRAGAAGIAWANEPSGRGWTPIFGGSSASLDERGHCPLGEPEPLLERRHRGRDVGRRRGSASGIGSSSPIGVDIGPRV